jgi:hypothetical protein
VIIAAAAAERLRSHTASGQ